MAFNMLAMLYMQAAYSKKKNRQANKSKSAKRSWTNLVRSKPIQSSVCIRRGANTVHAQIPKEERICRVCGKDGVISIFDSTKDCNIVKDIITIARVEIKENDGLPSHICAECLESLKNALQFKINCEKMDTELRAKLEEMEQARIKEQERLEKKYKHVAEECFIDDLGSGFSLFFSNENETFDILDEDSDNQLEEAKGGFVDCLKCNMCFMDKEEYKAHLLTCDIVCEKLLKRKQEIIPEKFPWLCDVCGKVFKNRHNLLKHRIVHTDELPFSCDKCPYRGRSKDQLRMHYRVHTGERPYNCQHCPRAFVNLSNLRRHQAVHGSHRQHTCSICNKGLSTMRALKDHQQAMHLDEKPYKCDICGTCLATRRGLISHRLGVHKVKAAYPRVANYLRIDEKAKQRYDADQNATLI